jgi:PAS domain S-box-containing protein
MAGKLNIENSWSNDIAEQSAFEASLRLAAIVESSQDAIISKTLDGIITSWNAAASHMFGYSPEEMIGQPIFKLIPPEMHAEEHEILKKLRSGERIQHYETYRLCKDGTRREVSLTISPIKNERGVVIGASKIARDISDRKRANEARFRLAAIVDSSEDAIISKDLNGIVTSWNTAAERLFGYSAKEMIGKSILTIIPPELHSEEPEILRTLIAGKRIEHHETVRLRKDGQRVAVSLSISPLRDQDGHIIGASKTARDISERQRVQEALIESEKLAATGRMAAEIAHEMNNPLEAVTNLAYLLATDTTLNAAARSYSNLLLEEVSRANEITKQALAFYRDLGKPVEFDIRNVIDGVVTLNRSTLGKRGIQVVKEYKQSEPLFGYEAEIRQVFANLLSNAMDAVPDGGKIVIRVSIQNTSVKQRRIRVTIADEGSGIPVENRKRLFDPFFTTKGARCNGLGLWVCRGIARKHAAKILVRSTTKPGSSGTVFSVLIPLRKAAGSMTRSA